MKPLGVILAGGRATRMGGGDKGLRQLGGRTMLEHVIARLGGQVDGMALNANGDAARFAAFGLPVLPDGAAGQPGPLAGVLAGMDWAADSGASHIATAAADSPFLPLDMVQRLQETTDADHLIALAATADGRQPTCGLWPVALRDDLRAALADGTRKIVAWTDRHGTALARFDDPDAFFNVNTPDDLIRAEAML